MRIGIAIENFDPRRGGAERSTDQIARELRRRGHDVTIVCGAAPSDAAGDLRLWRWARRKPQTGLGAMLFHRWATRQLFGASFDATLSVTSIVPAHLVQPRPGIVRESMIRAVVAGGSGWRGAVRRAGQVLSARKHALLLLERRTFADPRVGRFVAISRYMRQQMIDHYRVPSRMIELVPNAVDVPPISPDERAALRRDLRAVNGWSDDQPVVLFPALDARRKGMAPLLRALGRVADRVPDVRLAAAGRCPGWAQRLARSLGMAERIVDLGVVESMIGWYCAADVTAIPSYYDPASKVVIESMALGTPVLTSRYNGSADWIEQCADPSMGRVVTEPDDVAALSEALVDLLGSGGGYVATGAPPFDPAVLGMARHVDRLESLLHEQSATPVAPGVVALRSPS